MIHYSHFAANRASRVPLLGAIASLAVIAIGFGDPQAGVATAAIAGMATTDQPATWAPVLRTGPRPDRLRTASNRSGSGLGYDPAGVEHAGVALVNQDRSAAGQPPLSESPALDVIASTRAQQLVTDGLTHMRPGTQIMAITQLLKQNNVAYTRDGENIYWMGGSSVVEAVSSAEAWWMTSPEHRDNILGSHFHQVGIGTAVDGAKIYVVAVFTD